MECPNIRLAGIVEESVVDGPGIRYTIFTQGCTHHCIGCHNQGSHDVEGGFIVHCDKVISEINQTKYLAGVTFSGGEPFLQPKACSYIATRIKKEYSIMAYTGYVLDDLLKLGEENPHILKFLHQIDILVDGPFIASLRSLNYRFKGSKNQRVIDLKKTFKENKIVLYCED